MPLSPLAAAVPAVPAPPRHVRLDESSLRARTRPRPWGPTSSPHLRSYSSPHRSYSRPYSQVSFRSASAHSRAQSSGARTPISPNSPRASVSTLHLQHLLENLELDQYNTFGVEEFRDGFFDASFYRPIENKTGQEHQPALLVDAATSQTPTSKRSSPLAPRSILHTQIDDVAFFFRSVLTTRQGISLAKSFLAYFIAYTLCLIPKSQGWLGRYSYWITIASLFNHPGRTIGSQIDGTVACAFGGALGLAIACLALEVASSTPAARNANGGVLACFLVLFIGGFSWIRCSLVSSYQIVISAGLAAFFLCLVETMDIAQGTWDKIRVWEFGIPWVLGLGISLVVNMVVSPDAGSRAVATALHNAIQASLEGLELPRVYNPEIHRNMSHQLVNLSEAVRDLRTEVTVTSLRPDDVEKLRNLLQAVIRDMMAVKADAVLFQDSPASPAIEIDEGERGGEEGGVAIDISSSNVSEDDIDAVSTISMTDGHIKIVKDAIAQPARELVNAMTEVLLGCDTELMTIAGHRQFLNHETSKVSLVSLQARLRATMQSFDDADVSLIDHPDLPSSYSTHPGLVELFIFVHPLRMTADSIDALATEVIKISDLSPRKRLFLPSYPWRKALYRTNPQVRHDRGGLSAAYYFRSKKEINNIMSRVHGRAYVPETEAPVPVEPRGKGKRVKPAGIGGIAKKTTLRYKAWRVLHRLQQFETRFAVKVVLVTVCLSAPAWLKESRGWWVENESWWGVIAAWFMMHPRVGGNLQDLVTRSITSALGAVWGGLAYSVGGGNPFVMAVFAAIFMIPCIFRFTLSSHPRSGLMGCISYSVVSLSAYTLNGETSASRVAWTRGSSIIVGIVSAVVVNWIVWPFVARHELRKSLSSMMLNIGISYRGVVARYIYYDAESEPTKEDLERSETQEARLREGLVRMQELLEMTRHEIRIRGPFNPTPYSAAIDSLECFLEHIVEVRRASLFFHPFHFGGGEEVSRKMISVRRDAVACILMNLYILAGALRAKRPVPRYLPSAAAARKRLLDRMREIEEENEATRVIRPKLEKSRRWADVYQYAYSSALTDIVGQLEELQAITKEIVGEMALDVPDLY